MVFRCAPGETSYLNNGNCGFASRIDSPLTWSPWCNEPPAIEGNYLDNL